MRDISSPFVNGGIFRIHNGNNEIRTGLSKKIIKFVLKFWFRIYINACFGK